MNENYNIAETLTVKSTDVRKANRRLSQSVFTKHDSPKKLVANDLSNKELIDWQARCIEDVRSEKKQMLKDGRTDERHLDGMKEQISDITLLLDYREQKKSKTHRE